MPASAEELLEILQGQILETGVLDLIPLSVIKEAASRYASMPNADPAPIKRILEETRSAAIQGICLDALGDMHAHNYLIQFALRNMDYSVRAIETLGNIHCMEALDALTRLIVERSSLVDDPILKAAIAAVSKIGMGVKVDQAFAKLEKESYLGREVEVELARAIGQWRLIDHTPWLLRKLITNDENTRKAAAEALRKFNPYEIEREILALSK